MFSSGTLAGNTQVSAATTNVEIHKVMTTAASESVDLLVQSMPRCMVHIQGTAVGGATASNVGQVLVSVYSATQPSELDNISDLNFVLLDDFLAQMTDGSFVAAPQYREYNIATKYIRVIVSFTADPPVGGSVAQFVLKVYSGQ